MNAPDCGHDGRRVAGTDKFGRTLCYACEHLQDDDVKRATLCATAQALRELTIDGIPTDVRKRLDLELSAYARRLDAVADAL